MVQTETDEEAERRVADKVLALLDQESMSLNVSVQKVPMKMPDGSAVWADRATVEIKRKRSPILIPGENPETRKIAMELLSGGKPK